MRMDLICVGRAKPGAERDLASRYIERAGTVGRRLGLTVAVKEIDESRARRPEDRKAEEAGLIAAEAGTGPLIALDETGAPIDSKRFATLLGDARDSGVPRLAIAIGGPDGLDPALLRRATHVISFGAMTWPHQLVRVMASEQIYRAATILAGHPYHRA